MRKQLRPVHTLELNSAFMRDSPCLAHCNSATKQLTLIYFPIAYQTTCWIRWTISLYSIALCMNWSNSGVYRLHDSVCEFWTIADIFHCFKTM